MSTLPPIPPGPSLPGAPLQTAISAPTRRRVSTWTVKQRVVAVCAVLALVILVVAEQVVTRMPNIFRSPIARSSMEVAELWNHFRSEVADQSTTVVAVSARVVELDNPDRSNRSPVATGTELEVTGFLDGQAATWMVGVTGDVTHSGRSRYPDLIWASSTDDFDFQQVLDIQEQYLESCSRPEGNLMVAVLDLPTSTNYVTATCTLSSQEANWTVHLIDGQSITDLTETDSKSRFVQGIELSAQVLPDHQATHIMWGLDDYPEFVQVEGTPITDMHGSSCTPQFIWTWYEAYEPSVTFSCGIGTPATEQAPFEIDRYDPNELYGSWESASSLQADFEFAKEYGHKVKTVHLTSGDGTTVNASFQPHYRRETITADSYQPA